MKPLKLILIYLGIFSILWLVFDFPFTKANSKLADQVIANDTDYRDQFTGYYHAFITYYHWWIGYPPITDTLDTIMIIDKFHGYTAGNDSNYIDIEHKLAIYYDSCSTEHDDSWCAWIDYYTEGFLHPTIDVSGELSYPELEDCEDGYLSGSFVGDSVNIKYGNSNKWHGFERTIKGKKDSVLTGLNSLTYDIRPEVVIYPNPASTSISILGVHFPVNVQIFDVTGDIRLIKLDCKGSIELQNLQSGIYFMRISVKNQLFTKKLIII